MWDMQVESKVYKVYMGFVIAGSRILFVTGGLIFCLISYAVATGGIYTLTLKCVFIRLDFPACFSSPSLVISAPSSLILTALSIDTSPRAAPFLFMCLSNGMRGKRVWGVHTQSWLFSHHFHPQRRALDCKNRSKDQREVRENTRIFALELLYR